MYNNLLKPRFEFSDFHAKGNYIGGTLLVVTLKRLSRRIITYLFST